MSSLEKKNIVMAKMLEGKVEVLDYQRNPPQVGELTLGFDFWCTLFYDIPQFGCGEAVPQNFPCHWSYAPRSTRIDNVVVFCVDVE
jgi:hypothetical protein